MAECNVGADAWRRTGVLTFDGNIRLPQRVTYERIRLHLQEVYISVIFRMDSSPALRGKKQETSVRKTLPWCSKGYYKTSTKGVYFKIQL